MPSKYVDVDFEYEDAEDFINSACESELSNLAECIKERCSLLEVKTPKSLWEISRVITCQVRTPADELALDQLQDLINLHGVDEILSRLNNFPKV